MQRLCPRTLQPRLLCVLAAAALLLAGPYVFQNAGPGLFEAQTLVARAVRTRDKYLEGRQHDIDPSPRCCLAEQCLTGSSKRHAIVTSLRSDAYAPLLQELACSLKKTNPDLPLLVLAVRFELSLAVVQNISRIAQLEYVEDIGISKHFYKEDGRYALNWIKLRVWELDQWDALLFLDCDTTVIGDLHSAFALPTDFAIALDHGRSTLRYSALGKAQAGVFMLRPCAAVAQHMLQLVTQDARLQFRFGHAEQDFLDWYYKYSRLALGVEWNAMAHKLSSAGLTYSGLPPKIIHYTENKPFLSSQQPAHQWLCTALTKLSS